MSADPRLAAPKRPLSIVPRSAWSAAAPKHAPVRVAWPQHGTLWVHYSAGAPPADDPAAEQQTIRAIQAFHQGPERGWSDIGYHYLVAPSGRAYEGRGYGVWGAHCPGHNAEPSVCLLWQDQHSLPPAAALDSVMELALYLGAKTLRAHREGFATACPGQAIFEWVVDHREVDAHEPPVGTLTLRQRLELAGYGPLSADQIIAALSAWDGERGFPRSGDSDMFRRLREAGFGPDSARKIIYAMRRAHQTEENIT